LASKLPAGDAFAQQKLRNKLFSQWDSNGDQFISLEETLDGLQKYWKINKKHPVNNIVEKI